MNAHLQVSIVGSVSLSRGKYSCKLHDVGISVKKDPPPDRVAEHPDSHLCHHGNGALALTTQIRSNVTDNTH